MRAWSRVLTTTLFSITLGGCDPQIELACPELKTYSPAVQKEMAAKYAALPQVFKDAVKDYATLRNMCRSLAKKGAQP